MRVYGQCNAAGPGNHHTPPPLPGSDREHTIDAIGVYGHDRYTPNGIAGTFSNLHQKTGVRTYWTEDRVNELADLLADGMTQQQISAVIGKTISSIGQAITRYRLTGKTPTVTAKLPAAACTRCGRIRTVNTSRSYSGLCMDCRYVASGSHGSGDWTEQAACRYDTDDQKWFPDTSNRAPHGTRRLIAEAKNTCATCPVKSECLNAALSEELANEGRHGIRGGLLPKERDEAARRRGHQHSMRTRETHPTIPCPECGAQFSALAVRRHVQRKHPGAPPLDARIECPDCGIKITPSSLGRHISRTHRKSS